jgi:putative addiction module CopG family antidote
MTLTLDPEFEAMVTNLLRSGRYNSANEVVREALLRLRDAEREESLRELQAFVQVGREDLDNGRSTTWKVGQTEELAERIRNGAQRLQDQRQVSPGDNSYLPDEAGPVGGDQWGPPESTT